MNFRASLAAAACLAALALSSSAAAPAARTRREDPNFAVVSYNRETSLPDLPSDVALCALQTRDGFLWVGTEGGLIRFDGVRITTFRTASAPGLPDNVIRCLHEDRAGTLWIGTEKGLACWRNEGIERVPGIAGPITDLAETPDGRIWIGTLDSGLLEMRGGRLISHAADPALKAHPRILRLLATATGRLWIGFRPRGAVVYDGGTFRPVARLPRGFGEIQRFFESADGSTWFATSRGLFRMKDGRFLAVGPAEGLEDEPVTDFLADSSGHLWLAARSLYRSTDSSATRFAPVPLPPESGVCRALTKDREGNIWVGTSGGGFLQLRETPFSLILPSTGLPGEGVRSVSQAPDGSLWAALAPRGLARVLPDGSMSFRDLGNGPDGEVWSVLAASDGRVWIGAVGCLYSLRNGVLERFPAYRDINVLYEDRTGSVWIGTRGHGVFRWTRGAFESMAGTVGDEESTSTAFAEDPAGNLYASLDRELLKISAGSVTSIAPGPGLSDYEIRAIYPDRDGNLWLGTKRGGLILLRNGRWMNPDALKEPFGDFVSAIVEDGRGNLWLGTPKGIVWAPKRAFLARAEGDRGTGVLHWAAANGGIQGATVGYGSQPVALAAADGTVWIATRAGLVRVHPENIPINRVPPNPSIERLVVDGTDVAVGRSIVLPAGTRNLEIDYTAPSFVRPTGASFRYQLVGRDPALIDAGGRRAAYYASLGPGRYRFRLFAANSDGVWNPASLELAVVQEAAYYQTWWFYAACGLAVAVAIVGGYLWRTHALRRENERLERSVAERTNELVQARKMEAVGQLAGGVAHDFNNILTSILMQIGLLRDDSGLRAETRASLGDLEKEALRAAALTRQLLAFSRRQVMRKKPFDLNAMLDELVGMLRRLLGENISLVFQGGAPLWVEADAGMIQQVATNLCVNARDAMTPRGGRLSIEARLLEIAPGERRASPEARPGLFACLSVEDTGSGMDAATLQHIFEPFFTTKDAGKGTGLGLATVYGITKQHRGWIEVDSERGRGSTFRVFLPALSRHAAAPAAPAAEKPAGGDETILLVEDEPAVRTMAARSLGRCGYRVLEAVDGPGALALWKAHAPGIDLLFSDVVMPGGISGLELAERLRRDDPGLCVILTSGYSVDLGRQGIPRESGFGYLAKPYEANTLAAAVRRCLDGNSRASLCKPAVPRHASPPSPDR